MTSCNIPTPEIPFKNPPKRWEQLFGIDFRTLALFRIGIALAILVDLWITWPDINLLLTDSGFYPRHISSGLTSPEWFHIFYLGGDYSFIVALFAFTALAALALMFGYYTRAATVICWLMVSSFNLRFVIYLSAADTQLNVMLFWAMFLPLGARFSVDRALALDPPKDERTVSAASIGLLLQVAYLYFMGALLKTNPIWTTDYGAVEAAIANAHLASPLSIYLYQFPQVAHWLTYYVYHVEFYSIFFLFCPWLNERLRLVTFLLLESLHVGFFLFLNVSYFPLVSGVGLTVFLPWIFWDKASAWAARKNIFPSYSIYYDEDCGFCKKICLIFRELSVFPKAPVEPAQQTPEIGEILERENSWVVRTGDGRILLRWDAVAYVWRSSPLLWPLGALFNVGGMRTIGGLIYGCIARNRDNLAAITAKILPYRPTLPTRPSLWNTAIVVPLILATFYWNIHNVKDYSSLPVPSALKRIMSDTKLSQRWGMFAPRPTTATDWAEVRGLLAGGQEVDLLWHTGKPPRTAWPTIATEAYPSMRWRKFFGRYNWKKSGKVFGAAVCRQWKEEGHNEELKQVIVTLYKQKNFPGTPRESWAVKPKILLDYSCVDKTAAVLKPEPEDSASEKAAPSPKANTKSSPAEDAAPEQEDNKTPVEEDAKTPPEDDN